MSIVLPEFSLYKDALTGRVYEDSCVLSNSNVVSAATSVVNPVAVSSIASVTASVDASVCCDVASIMLLLDCWMMSLWMLCC